MIRSAVVACAMSLAFQSSGPGQTLEERKESQRVAQRAVLRLTRESPDLQHTRRDLERSLSLDPGNRLARAYSGSVEYAGQWRTLDSIARLAREDVLLREYERKRGRIDSPAAHFALAKWCARRKMLDRADLHLSYALADRRNYTAEQRALMDKLGFAISNSTRSQANRASSQRGKRESDARPIDWFAQLKHAAQALQRPATRREALERIQSIKDPAAIAAISYHLSHTAELAQVAVATLGSMREHRATLELLRFAVLHDDESVRREAAEALAKRPFHDYVPLLLNRLEAPLKSCYWISIDAYGDIKYQHDLVKEGVQTDQLNRKRTHIRAIPFDLVFRRFGGMHPVDRRIARESIDARNTAALHLRLEVAKAEYQRRKHNLASEKNNERLLECLAATTSNVFGANALGDNPVDWWKWWYQYNEVQIPDRKNVVAHYYDRQASYVTVQRVLYNPSCFPAGTMVHSAKGPLAIETIKLGDRVLSQDVETGELKFKVVLGRTVRPPSGAVTIECERATFSATKGHPLWVVNQGWKMAKFIKKGDWLHSLRGPLQVKKVADIPDLEAYNLIVADTANYFITSQGIIAHDNTLRRPTQAVLPGLRK